MLSVCKKEPVAKGNHKHYIKEYIMTIITRCDIKMVNTYREHCTQWCKKNAFFSNNCNFFYFQYKKIMLTPKQPVINAVLITYID